MNYYSSVFVEYFLLKLPIRGDRMFRLLVTDLDGTLLTADKQVSKRDQRALRRLQHTGISLCLATGRNKMEVADVMRDMDDSYHQVTQNGAQVFTDNGQVLCAHYFHPTEALMLYRWIASLELYTRVIVDATVNIGDKQWMKRIIPEEQRTFFSVSDSNIFSYFSQLDEKIGKNVLPTKFSYFAELDVLNSIAESVHKRFPGKFSSFLSDTNCLDFMPLHIDKGSGVHSLLKHLELSPEEVVCVGDSENDLAMFAVIPNNFAMDTASPQVQANARSVVTGVADVVEWVLSQNEQFRIRSS